MGENKGCMCPHASPCIGTHTHERAHAVNAGSGALRYPADADLPFEFYGHDTWRIGSGESLVGSPQMRFVSRDGFGSGLTRILAH